jgi:hypothetical protein
MTLSRDRDSKLSVASALVGDTGETVGVADSRVDVGVGVADGHGPLHTPLTYV